MPLPPIIIGTDVCSCTTATRLSPHDLLHLEHGVSDTLGSLAATGLANGLPVFPCNPDDFSGIDGLTVVPIQVAPASLSPAGAPAVRSCRRKACTEASGPLKAVGI